MNKLWKPSEPKSDKLIFIKNQIIYKGNPHREKINKFKLETSSNIEIEKELFSIPYNYIKDDIKGLKYKSKLPSFFNYCKAQVFAILILTGVFIWSMYYAIEMANGAVFELCGGGRLGLDGLVFILANLGKTKLIIGYSVFIGIAFLSLFRKLKSRTERQVLYR